MAAASLIMWGLDSVDPAVSEYQRFPSPMMYNLSDKETQGCLDMGGEEGWREQKTTRAREKKLTFLVATNISTRRCLTRLEVSSGKGVVSAVSSPISCVHAVPDEKKLKGKYLSTTNFKAKSSRFLMKEKRRKPSNCKSVKPSKICETKWSELLGQQRAHRK